MTAIERWNTRVSKHHAQSIRAQEEMEAANPSTWTKGDFWEKFANNFRGDPRRADDPVVERIARELTPDSTLLDVGGGGGRLALPLALRCKKVTVVEPSQSMIDVLKESASEFEIGNVEIVQDTWEEANVEPADFVLCSHVVYGVDDVEPFLAKLNSHARQCVYMPTFTAAPITRFGAFWEPVHGEERSNLPGLPELLSVLWDMDIYPDVEMMDALRMSRGFKSREDALEQLRLRVYANPGTEKDALLQKAMDSMLTETDDGLVIESARPARLGIVNWKPA